MAWTLRGRFVAPLLACGLALGCPGKDGKDGAQGAQGAPAANPLVQVTPEPAGSNCVTGGTRVQSGLDANADGLLEPGEVTATRYVCDGATGQGSILALTPEAAGANCVAGGTRVQSGLDADADGTLDATEVASTQYVCGGADGRAALVDATPEAAGANCAAGGLLVQSGFDADSNGLLDVTEVALSQYLCNGTNGVGALVSTSAAAAGCGWGGTRVDSGLDLNGNGALDASEATATQYVCNGAPGANGHAALVARTPELPGANCAAGGTKVEAGLDLDADATLDLSEITSTGYVCDGADGASGLLSLLVGSAEPAGINCPDAGLRIQSGLDANANLTLDAAEIASTSWVCNGADGADGQTALVETYFEPSGANCAWGGLRVLSGLDADGDGLLGGTDPVLTQYVCDGAPGLLSLVTTLPEPAGANCADGGIRIDSGLDANRSGALDAGEIASTRYVCDGPAGPEGLKALVVTSPEPEGTNCADGGTRIDSGSDANRNGILDPGELASAWVCNESSPGPLAVTSPEPPGVNCVYGGSRIEFASDANGNGLIDAGELEATAWACNGATGTGLVTLLVTTVEPPGANCAAGGTRIDSGPDLDGDGLLAPGEITSTNYLCLGDSTHPFVIGANPPPASPYVDPSANFCVTFSEPIDPATLTPSSLFVTMNGGPVAADITYDPVSLTACVDPVLPLELWSSVTFEARRAIRDLAGNVLTPSFFASYTLEPPPPPNLTLLLMDATPGATGGVDVRCRVSNEGGGAAGPFTIGVFFDAPSDPGVGSVPQGSYAVAELAALTTTTVTVNVPVASWTTVLGYVDLYGEVGESDEGDNLGRLPGRITGSPIVTPSPAELLETITVTVPVNVTARHVLVGVSGPHPAGPTWWLGWLNGNYAGEAAISGSFALPNDPAMLGDWTLIVEVWDDAHLAGRRFVHDPAYSSTTYTGYDTVDGAFSNVTTRPLTPLSIVPSTRPNLTVTVDSVTDLGTGFVDVAWTVANAGPGDAGPSTVGLFADPTSLPGGGSTPDASGDVPALAAGTSSSGVVQMVGSAATAIVAFADVYAAIPEISEDDNHFVPPPILTGPITADTATFERGMYVTITVPVGPGVRYAEVLLGQDYGYTSYFLVGAYGNYAGEGYISAAVLVPEGWPTMDATLWVNVFDGWWIRGQRYAAVSWVSVTNLARLDGSTGSWVDSGIPLTPVTVVPPSAPNFTVSIDAVTDLGTGYFDVTYTVTNSGNEDAGDSTVGFFVDWPGLPGPGYTPDVAAAVAPLAVGTSASATVTIAAGASIVAIADVEGTVAELDEEDNWATYLLPPTSTFASAGPVGIADLSIATSDISVAGGPAAVGIMAVTLDISHSYIGDLVIFVTSPAGTTVRLVTHRGNGYDAYAGTTFLDLAVTPIGSGAPPFSGYYRPEEPLSTISGQDPAGTWTLTVSDEWGGDSGVLNSWSLSFW